MKTMREALRDALIVAARRSGGSYRRSIDRLAISPDAAIDAILDELLEPDEAMNEAGNATLRTVLHNASSVWQAMVNQIRKEEL